MRPTICWLVALRNNETKRVNKQCQVLAASGDIEGIGKRKAARNVNSNGQMHFAILA